MRTRITELVNSVLADEAGAGNISNVCKPPELEPQPRARAMAAQ